MTTGEETITTSRKRVRVTVSGDSMSATLILFKPSPGDASISLDEVLKEIEKSGIVYGLDRETVEKCVSEENYNNPTQIAAGKKPQRGDDSTFTYHFETTAKWAPKEDEDGRIDYKNINFIQSVEKDALLVTKTPPTAGIPGMTVKGRELPGLSGRDLPFNNGANTRVSEDGLSLNATTGGSILFLYSKVSVNDLTIINSDVDFNVGNIDCRGSVRINGDVKAGFTIKIDGDLEINGNVEDCIIEVKGNILVKGGFYGKGEGYMKAGGDITMKYSEGQRIECENLYVGGEIINCRILAQEKIWVKGKNGKIVGGTVKAGKEIRASVLGTKAGTTTVLHVMLDSELIKKYKIIIDEIERLGADEARIKEAMVALYRLQMDNKLTPDKAQVLKKFEKFQADLPGNIEHLKKQKAAIGEELAKFKETGIIAEDIVYPGVKAYFGLIYRTIQDETKKCKLSLEGSQVLMSEYRD